MMMSKCDDGVETFLNKITCMVCIMNPEVGGFCKPQLRHS